ncbi:hypothetical protein QJS10_CPB21g00448 [Acorus calamus]|uniref:Cytochrome P450 n=1 Tax=Acorus calamus TaxID=4465 RepID=A0AAV9C5S9_ACOCL|nr:hypothetical protein QJS10_CPB21g00448 [Acorus calamus]
MAFVFVVSPTLVHRRLRRNGFTRPPPRFPLGNILDMAKEKIKRDPFEGPLEVSHDIHSMVFPHFAQWRKLYGKVFIYWLGTEPFLYIADPEYLKAISSVVVTKKWGKPTVFRRDRQPMFGDGLVMVEGDRWVTNRHSITPLFSMSNLNVSLSNPNIISFSTKASDKLKDPFHPIARPLLMLEML